MAKANSSVGVIEGFLVYVKIAQPSKKYQSENLEFSVGVIIGEDEADEFSEKFSKQPAKKIRVGDFEDKYRFECPIKNVKNVYLVNLKRDAVIDGVETVAQYCPKIFLDMNDGEREEISQTKLVANGTFAKVSYYISDNQYGTFARLQNVLIKEDNFIEYVSTGAGPAGSEFGDSGNKKTVADTSKDKAVKKVVKKVADEENIESPF